VEAFRQVNNFLDNYGDPSRNLLQFVQVSVVNRAICGVITEQERVGYLLFVTRANIQESSTKVCVLLNTAPVYLSVNRLRVDRQYLNLRRIVYYFFFTPISMLLQERRR